MPGDWTGKIVNKCYGGWSLIKLKPKNCIIRCFRYVRNVIIIKPQIKSQINDSHSLLPNVSPEHRQPKDFQAASSEGNSCKFTAGRGAVMHHAQCITLGVPGSMHHAQCTTLSAARSVHHAQLTTLSALRSVHHTQCTTLSAPRTMQHAQCITLNTPSIMTPRIHHTQCTIINKYAWKQ